MLDLTLVEAQLLRILSGLFGKDHVIPHMSIMAVCGGKIPVDYDVQGFDLRAWARESKCLFTIVDDQDSPRAVFEFFSGFGDVVEPEAVLHERYLRPLLRHMGIRYITITEEEFNEILTPGGNLDFFSLVKAQLEEEFD